MRPGFLGEFAGTAVMILLGNGVVAGTVLKQTYSHASGWMVITAAWGLAVIAGVFTALSLGSDAHLNPAVTVGFAIASNDWSRASTYIPAQILGAMLGALIVWVHYLPHWQATDDPRGKRACFCTAPAIAHRAANLAGEFIGTFVLIFVIAAMSSKHVFASGPAAGMGPFLVGLLVFGIGLSLGGTTGYAINPARDLGPRIMHTLLPIHGKGSSEWNYAVVPIIAPIAGAAIAGWTVRMLEM